MNPTPMLMYLLHEAGGIDTLHSSLGEARRTIRQFNVREWEHLTLTRFAVDATINNTVKMDVRQVMTARYPVCTRDPCDCVKEFRPDLCKMRLRGSSDELEDSQLERRTYKYIPAPSYRYELNCGHPPRHAAFWDLRVFGYRAVDADALVIMLKAFDDKTYVVFAHVGKYWNMFVVRKYSSDVGWLFDMRSSGGGHDRIEDIRQSDRSNEINTLNSNDQPDINPAPKEHDVKKYNCPQTTLSERSDAAVDDRVLSLTLDDGSLVELSLVGDNQIKFASMSAPQGHKVRDAVGFERILIVALREVLVFMNDRVVRWQTVMDDRTRGVHADGSPRFTLERCQVDPKVFCSSSSQFTMERCQIDPKVFCSLKRPRTKAEIERYVRLFGDVLAERERIDGVVKRAVKKNADARRAMKMKTKWKAKEKTGAVQKGEQGRKGKPRT